MTRQEIVANELLKIKAVSLSPSDPYTWASGIKSPIYCDNRLILSYVESRDIIEKELSKMIAQNYPNVDAIIGTATAGISHAAIVACHLNKPMAYVRSKAKDHGRQKLIEGFIEPGKKVVVVEDLLSSGKSSLSIVDILRKEGYDVLGIASIFTYNMAVCERNLSQSKCKNFSLTNFDVLIKLALEKKYIDKEGYDKLLKFRQNPGI